MRLVSARTRRSAHLHAAASASPRSAFTLERCEQSPGVRLQATETFCVLPHSFSTRTPRQSRKSYTSMSFVCYSCLASVPRLCPSTPTPSAQKKEPRKKRALDGVTSQLSNSVSFKFKSERTPSSPSHARAQRDCARKPYRWGLRPGRPQLLPPHTSPSHTFNLFTGLGL